MEAPQRREPGFGEQAVAVIVDRVVDELIEAAPQLAAWVNTRAIPAIKAKGDELLLRHQTRKAKKALRAKATTTALVAEPVVEDRATPTQQGVAAPAEPKITMTSEQFQQLFMTWLAREDAQQALWQALANADIKADDEAALAWREAFNELSPEQRTESVKGILSANPSILEDLGRHLADRGPLELDESIGRRDKRCSPSGN